MTKVYSAEQMVTLASNIGQAIQAKSEETLQEVYRLIEELDTEAGSTGLDGKSAYELAVDNGFVGTVEEYLESLIGAKGATGAKGAKGDTGAAGTDGVDGADGAQGIQGEKGEKGDTGAKGEKGDSGTGTGGGADGVDGEDGKSAYQVALANGFVGTEVEWLASLKGEKGEKGNTGAAGSGSGSGSGGVFLPDGRELKHLVLEFTNGSSGITTVPHSLGKKAFLSCEVSVVTNNNNVETHFTNDGFNFNKYTATISSSSVVVSSTAGQGGDVLNKPMRAFITYLDLPPEL